MTTALIKRLPLGMTLLETMWFHAAMLRCEPLIAASIIERALARSLVIPKVSFSGSNYSSAKMDEFQWKVRVRGVDF